MADKVVRDVLVAAGAVTALVSTRISPLIKSQGVTPPAVTIRRGTLEPQNHLRGDGDLDKNTVMVDSWATTYVGARAVADACRTALLAAGILLQGEFDNYEPGIDPGLYNISQEYLVWT